MCNVMIYVTMISSVRSTRSTGICKEASPCSLPTGMPFKKDGSETEGQRATDLQQQLLQQKSAPQRTRMQQPTLLAAPPRPLRMQQPKHCPFLHRQPQTY